MAYRKGLVQSTVPQKWLIWCAWLELCLHLQLAPIAREDH